VPNEVAVSGLVIGYDRAGSGPPVALAHGFVGDGCSTWGSQLEALADEFTVVAWDAPGAGRSSDPPEGFGMDDYADSFAALLRALGIERAHLVGLSFGGALVLATFHRHRELVSSLALVSGYAGWRGSLGAGEADHRLTGSLQASGLPPDEFVAAMVPSMFSRSAGGDRVIPPKPRTGTPHAAGAESYTRR
jgi:pimeloyl-ACP methyl ester carboxylesterase